MLAKIKKRIKNPKVILAIVSGVLMILVNLGIVDLDFSKHVTESVNTVLGILISIGIFGNPESHVKDELTE